MEKLLEWMKGIVLLFFLLSALLYFVPRDVYKKYIRFFMELILVLAILLPIIKVLYDGDAFEKMVHYDEFWQQMDNLQMDVEHMEYIQNEYYVEEYEKSMENDIENMVKEYGYEALEVSVELNESYEIENIELSVKKTEAFEGDFDAMKKALLDFYQVEEKNLEISVQ